MAAFLHRVVAPLPAGPYPAPTAGQTLYVALTGSDDGNDCMAEAGPCRTVAYAIAGAIDGDSTRVGPGTFAEKALSISAEIDIEGDAGGGTTIDFTGLGLYETVIQVVTADPLALDHLTITSAKGGLIETDGDLSILASTITETSINPFCYGSGCWPSVEITDSTVSGSVGTDGSHGSANTMSILRSSVGRVGATSLTVAESTLAGLSASTLAITDSTVSGGIHAGSGTVSGTTVTGGGIYGNQLTVVNSTITSGDVGILFSGVPGPLPS